MLLFAREMQHFLQKKKKKYREPLNTGFTCQNVSPVPELLSPAEPVLEAFTAGCSSLVTRINLAH